MSSSPLQQAPVRDKSVPYGNDEAILEAFREDGYCVVTGVLTDGQVEAMVDELWSSERLLGRFDRHDPETWTGSLWPQQQTAGGRNFLQSADVYQDCVSWDLAGNERLLRVQQLLYGRKDLMMCSLGRFGVMRPTKHHPEWRTDSSWLHWDQNPNTQPGFRKVQCVVCLTDSTPTTGGFECVPGFHRRFRQWGERHPAGSVVVDGRVVNETYGAGQPFPVPPDDPCRAEAVRVVAPAGSAVLWDSRLPHQNFPNTDGEAFRVVHYTNMMVREDEAVRHRQRLLHQKLVLMELTGQEGPRFPHNLSASARYVHCLDEAPKSLEELLEALDVQDADGLREAARLVHEAGELEERGETASAIQLHQRSMRLFPEIEQWHEVIFGGS
jgi:hypothetical protein